MSNIVDLAAAVADTLADYNAEVLYFPTFDLPDKAISGRGSLGNCLDAPTVMI